MFINGELDRPSYTDNALRDTVGYLTTVWVEQEGSRDTIRFRLQIYTSSLNGGSGEKTFWLPLDTNTTVALAQFQLLLDALHSMWFDARATPRGPLLVRVHFSPHTEHEVGWVYWLGVYEGLGEETAVDDFYHADRLTGGWYAQHDASAPI